MVCLFLSYFLVICHLEINGKEHVKWKDTFPFMTNPSDEDQERPSAISAFRNGISVNHWCNTGVLSLPLKYDFYVFLSWGKEDALRIDKFDLIFNKMARNSVKQVISYHIFHYWFVRVVLILFLSSLQRGRRNISWRIGAAEQLYILSNLILLWDHALLAAGLSSGKKKSIKPCVWDKFKNCV